MQRELIQAILIAMAFVGCTAHTVERNILNPDSLSQLGTIAAVSRSYEPIIDYPKTPLEKFVRFARYPQGLPPDLNRDEIRVKPQKPRG